MTRTGIAIRLAMFLLLVAPPVHAGVSGRSLVLPLRTIGVSDTIAFVSHDLLVGSLRDLGMEVIGPPNGEPPRVPGPDACDARDCAAELGRRHSADQVVYGSLSRLGGKIIARLDVVRVEEPAPYYRDQLTAESVEDLDKVMRRFAEGIAAGRPNSDRASVESVTRNETLAPARRATRSGLGLRAGFLFPTGNSFGGADRLTNLHVAYKYEMRDYQIETTTLLGFSWDEGNRDWTILDLSASRIFGTGDFAPFAGVGIGVHSVNVERQQDYTATSPYGPPYTYAAGVSETVTAPAADLFGGFMAMRTYDFELILEVRFHYVFERFDPTGGDGANGVMLTFGTGR